MAAAVGLLVLIGVGCGGSDNSATGAESADEVTVTTGSLSKEEFIKKADALCTTTQTEYSKSVAKFATNVAKRRSAAEEVELREKLISEVFVPAYTELADEISALGAPQEDEAEVTAFVRSIHQTLEEASEGSKSFDYLNPFEKPVQLAGEYGLIGCVNSFT